MKIAFNTVRDFLGVEKSYTYSKFQQDIKKQADKISDIGLRSIAIAGAALAVSIAIDLGAYIASPVISNVVFYAGIAYAIAHSFVPVLKEPTEKLFAFADTFLSENFGVDDLIPKHWTTQNVRTPTSPDKL